MPVTESDTDYSSGEYSYWKIIKKFYYSYLRQRKTKYFTIQFLHVVGALLALIPPLILRSIIDNAIPSEDFNEIMILVFWAFLVYLSSNIIRYFRVYFGHKYAQYITRDMRNDLYNQYQKLSMSFHDNKKTGELMSRIIDDLNQLQEFVHHGPEAIIASGVLVLGTAVILFTMSVRLAIVSLIFAPLLLAFGYYLMSRMHKAFRKTRENKAEMSDKLEDSLAGIKVIKAFANENYEMNNFAEKNQKHADTRMWAVKYMSTLFSGSRILNAIGILAVLSYGGYLTAQGSLSAGTIVAFYAYLERFRGPLLRLVQTGEGMSRFFASTERFFKHIELIPEIKNDSGTAGAENIEGVVEFKNVEFTYDQEKILRNVNFKAEKNQTIALVGPSGAGKTTIVRLIPRLYELDSGEILIDGINVKDYDIEELRNSIAMVMQEDFLFSTSVAENIAYGKPDASQEEIIECAKKANAHQFISEELSDGYETQVGQRGVKLSGGQRQRISIARAFLKDPKILILDEATSSVDLETEELIQEAIDEVTHGRTTFIIAHRLATIINADEILFIQDGQILEKGTHEKLNNADTNYNRFYSKQFQNK
ncbi:MAG: ABC transporter ATP-binding protein [Bacillota bacterium]